VSARLRGLLQGSGPVRVTTPAGTDCTFDIGERAWIVDDGNLKAGQMVNLPAGEVFAAPLRTGADGVCVIDCSIALDDIGAVSQPVRLVFDHGRIVTIEGGREADSVRRAIADAGAGADTVAELGIGTNPSARITGSIITDEKVLGTAHVAFGDNRLSYGGDNESSIHVDCVMADATIEAGGRVLLARGGF
jgi:leucyl aminopeptidase (aminopeptidase T)